MLVCAFHRRARGAVTALWLTGVVIAGVTAVVAGLRVSAASALVFAVVAAALLLLAAGTAVAARWALRTSFVLLGAQIAGALGSAFELVHGGDSSKARELRALGIDPTLGVALNFAYSAVASALFVWVAGRLVRRCRGRTCAAAELSAADRASQLDESWSSISRRPKAR